MTSGMTTFHDFKAKNIDGAEQSLADFRGKVVLVVNVASECGFTPQYAGLEALHRELKDKGFAVVGFPSNDFGAQEPGTDEQIKTFCSSKYDVTFPLFSKIPVKGEGKHPLYEWLTTTAQPPGEVRWNFEKYLVGKDGSFLRRFSSKVDPASPDLRAEIEKALALETGHPGRDEHATSRLAQTTTCFCCRARRASVSAPSTPMSRSCARASFPVPASRARTWRMPSASISKVTEISTSPRSPSRRPESSTSPSCVFSEKRPLSPCATRTRTTFW
jgi:glutathione peroxidase